MTFLDWDEAVRLADAHGERLQALIYLAVDSGMRWSELVGLRRGKVDLRNRKVRVTEQLVHLEDGAFFARNPRRPPVCARSRSRRTRRPCWLRTSTGSGRWARTSWCSPTAPETRSARRASSRTTSPRPRRQPTWSAGSTTCATRASRWPSRPAPTRRRSRPAWVTRRSTTPSTATATSSPNSTAASPDAFGIALREAADRRASVVVPASF
jgi:integrase